MHISIEAQKYFLSLLSDQQEDTNIRIFVVNPGTLEAECGISYCEKNEVSKNDVVLDFIEFKVYIEKTFFPYLKDSEIDLVKDNLNSQIIFKAPYVKNQLYNSNNFSLFDKINMLLDREINPNLAAHKGHVKLLKITDNNYALLQFTGGCNGCSMIKNTLKENIEKVLLKNFPEIRGTIDITQHKYGNHSYT